MEIKSEKRFRFYKGLKKSPWGIIHAWSWP